jgi:hypothetical protein
MRSLRIDPTQRDMTVDQWCERRGYSRSYFYVLKRGGKAPRLRGEGKAQRISTGADAEWLAAREAESNEVVRDLVDKGEAEAARC